jgi:hypothetical protein
MTFQQATASVQGQPLVGGRLVLTDAGSIASSLSQRRVGYSSLRNVRKLVPSSARAVDDGIADAVAGMLDIDLGDVLLGCWSRYTEIKAAMRRTAADPTSEEIVVLARHRVSSSYRPTVSLFVDQVRVHTFEFDLSVDNDITSVAVEVRGGRVDAARSGRCHTAVKLELDGFVLREWQLDLDLGLVVHLDNASGDQTVPPGDGQGANALR